MLMVASPANAARDVSESLNAADDGRVSISNTSGAIEVEGWSRNQVEVTGTIGDDVEELIFERNGDRNGDGYTNLENYLHWAGRYR